MNKLTSFPILIIFLVSILTDPSIQAKSTNNLIGGNGDNNSFLRVSSYSKEISDTFPQKKASGQDSQWEILFSKDCNGCIDKWRGLDSDTFPSDAWTIRDGSLFVRNHKTNRSIMTREIFRDFELKFAFKLTDKANSGIKYLVNYIKNNEKGNRLWNGPEYQIIDDYNNKYVKDHKHDIGSTAALYLLYKPKNKKLHPAGEWNRGKIIVNGNHIEHWLNGVKVVSCERGTPDFKKRVAQTKFKVYTDYAEYPSGHILLQDHGGDRVYYRNIKIKRLNQ